MAVLNVSHVCVSCLGDADPQLPGTVCVPAREIVDIGAGMLLTEPSWICQDCAPQWVDWSALEESDDPVDCVDWYECESYIDPYAEGDE